MQSSVYDLLMLQIYLILDISSFKKCQAQIVHNVWASVYFHHMWNKCRLSQCLAERSSAKQISEQKLAVHQ